MWFKPVVVGLAALIVLGGGSAAGSARSPRTANYSIEATLDPVAKTVRGRERLRWRNSATDAARDLYFHLYLNAFANNRTTLLREYRFTQRGGSLDDWRDGWGWVDVQSIRVEGEERVGALEAAHPDDSNPDDRTVVRLPLVRPVAPGEAIDVDITFVVHLPKLLLRSGYVGNFFFVAQWFPKVGVYEGGRWNCHQYHGTTEFFADFGVYEVSLTTPVAFVVGATGVREEERENGDGTRTVRYLAEDVHDFVWTAAPDFAEVRDQFDDVQLRLLCRARGCQGADRYLTALKHAMTWFRDHIEPYPYPTLTVVDPGWFGLAAGGMEYPTLITLLPARWIPRGLRLPEFVTVHEFGHQYWYGLVANNEFEEAWLDEGVNSYIEGKIMDEAYGTGGSYVDMLGVRMNAIGVERALVMLAGSTDPIMQPAWEFPDARNYRGTTYSKTALGLRTLEGYVGEERVLAGLQAYFRRWRFGHPRGTDFIQAMGEAAGQDLAWFFDQVFRQGGAVDYAVTRIDTSPVEAFAGIRPAEEAVLVPSAEGYQSTVVIERLGDARLPVEVTVVFDDGSEMRERWDGQARWRRFEYSGTQRASHAVVDAGGAIPLDVNPINNSRMRQRGTRGLVRLGLRWGFWLQNLLHLLTAF